MSGMQCKPRKQRAVIAEDCQGRFLSLPLLQHSFAEAFSFFSLFFSSVFEPFLNKVVVLLHPTVMTELTCVVIIIILDRIIYYENFHMFSSLQFMCHQVQTQRMQQTRSAATSSTLRLLPPTHLKLRF